MKKNEAEAQQEKIKKQQAIKKAAARRFNINNIPHGIAAAECSPEYWPTKAQYRRWAMYLQTEKGVSPDGWWFGCCPIHDPMGRGETSAQISFVAGAMRCLSGEGCHPGQRAISLVNAMDVVMQRLVADDAEPF